MISQPPGSISSMRSARASMRKRPAGWADGDGAVASRSPAAACRRAARRSRWRRTSAPGAGSAATRRRARPAPSAASPRCFSPSASNSADGVGRQQAGGMCLQELVERVVQRRAAIGRAQLGFQRIERLQPQDAPRIEPVGIAPPLLDARDRKPRRPRLERRARLGTWPRPVGRRAGRARRPRRGSCCGRAGCIPAARRRCRGS